MRSGSFSFVGKTVSGEPTESNADLFRIPLLREVFQRYPTAWINLDVKEDNDELIRQVGNDGANFAQKFASWRFLI